jgi:hypothetical protein
MFLSMDSLKIKKVIIFQEKAGLGVQPQKKNIL